MQKLDEKLLSSNPFIFNESDRIIACVGENGGTDDEDILQGFKSTVLLIVNNIINEHGTEDELIYPLVYSVRHCVELALKISIVEDNLDQISGELADDVSVEEREKLLGITQEEVLDFADWLNDHAPMYLMRAQIYQVLIEKGLSNEEAEFLVRDLNILQKSIETAEALGLIDLDGQDEKE